VVFYGDHRKEFQNLAGLLGYEVVEKDAENLNIRKGA